MTGAARIGAAGIGAARVRDVDISVVVQGPIVGTPTDAPDAQLTRRSLESVRRVLPGAELVLSTWQGADVRGLPFDRLCLSDDPGTTRCDAPGANVGPRFYNANRQIVSTCAGLRAAQRDHAVKLRSDMVLTGDGFLDYFARYRERGASWRILGERVVVPTYYSRNPHLRLPYPFHPSDWFHFGRREDVLDIWDVPLAPPEMIRWFDGHPRPAGDVERWASYRYTAEQWVWLQFLRKHGDVPFDHKRDTREEMIRLSELAIANNLVLASPRQLGIRFLKYPHSLVHWSTLYTHGEWQRLYRAHAAPDVHLRPDVALVARDLYTAWVRPIHELLLSPRTTVLGTAVSATWQRRAPRSFANAKRVYQSAWSLMGRLARR